MDIEICILSKRRSAACGAFDSRSYLNFGATVMTKFDSRLFRLLENWLYKEVVAWELKLDSLTS